jgi:DNA-binding transcriptional MerR regulator
MKYGKVKTEKLYFSSSETAELLGISVNLLHSWEKEFPALNPKKNKSGKRIYRQNDIETAKEIKEKTAVGNSTHKNAGQNKPVAKKQKNDSREFLLEIRDKLRKILDRISSNKH